MGHLLQGRFTAILVEKEAHLLELCCYVVLNPVRAKMVPHPRQWAWSSYRGTAGELTGAVWLSTDWILGHFGAGQRAAYRRYRQFVAEGHNGPRPWEDVQGQIYLGSDDFITQHQPNGRIREIPRRQTQATRPAFREIFLRRGGEARLISVAYRQYGYRLAEIAAHLGVHAATISRRLKQAEETMS